VLNVRINARLNGVPVRALRGNLLTAVEGERFDLILANPPYLPGPPPPSRGAARAWDAGQDGREILNRICAEAPAYLKPGGALLIVHSAVCGTDETLAAYARRGLAAEVAACERGPLGPLLRARRAELEARGLLRPGQDTEEVSVLRGRAEPSQHATHQTDALLTTQRAPAMSNRPRPKRTRTRTTEHHSA
jgi:release factor glutamine methyltransferase